MLIDAGIDLSSYDSDFDDSRIRDEYCIARENIVLFFMGGIYEFAGMKGLAWALGKAKDKYPNYKVLVVGDGDAYDGMCEIRDEYLLKMPVNMSNQMIGKSLPISLKMS